MTTRPISDTVSLVRDDDAEGVGMDPVIAASVAKAAGTAGIEAAAATRNLFTRMFGPAADEIGTAFARWTSYRVGNAQRIVEKAETKTRTEGGAVPPRVAAHLLEDGSWVEDELTAEYLSGVLAGSRTPDGSDDRGMVWAATVTGMSALEIRAHFLLYRAWAERLPLEASGVLWGRLRQCRMDINQGHFIAQLLGNSRLQSAPALTHALMGLERRGLLGDVAWGPKDHLNYRDPAYDYVVIVQPTAAGMELYGWGLGAPDITPASFLDFKAPSWDESYPQLQQIAFPTLTKESGETTKPPAPQEEGGATP